MTEDTKFEKVFETWDSYEFLDASKILKDAGIPFTGDERYTGEFRVGKRAQAPYIWTILVPSEKAEEALRLLGDKISGEPIWVPPVMMEPIKPEQRWAYIASMVATAIILTIILWK
jgi:hypothetical protein